MTSSDARVRMVGIDLQENDDSRAIVDALEEDNADVVISRMPGLVRVQCPQRLVVKQASVERHLGRPWETHEFQLSIISYFGHIDEWDDDEIVVAWDH
jgi:phenol/toluene 2-monooxygenase (NADH) P2/A2